MNSLQRTSSTTATMPLVVMTYLVLIVVELVAILLLNDGHFMFTLDDPYIHLSLAENIWHGHYGVNAEEYSAPASSILWPFLLAPLTVFTFSPLLVFAINIFAGIATLYLGLNILQNIQQEMKYSFSVKKLVMVLVVLMLAVNLVGLTFIGMEHSIQILLAVIMAGGLIEKIQGGKTGLLLIAAIIAAPLIRYENAIISAVALLFLLLQKDVLKSIIAGLLIVAFLTAFSLYLLSLGLHFLPDSILAKSSVASSGMASLFENAVNNFLPPNTGKAIAMLLLAVWSIAVSCSKMLPGNTRLLSASVAMAIFLHLLGGRIGWYFRYEMALWAFVIPLFFYVHVNIAQKAAGMWLHKTGKIMAGIIVLIAMLESAVVLSTTPLAASNIYHQQYQLHRFITEIYRKPVAVNDLGWTSYRNNNYVLDLWGLGNSKARELRKSSNNTNWMEALAAEHNIELIMIYHNEKWFPQVPDNWIKVAELDIAGPKITAWYPVSIFVRNEQRLVTVKGLLQQWDATLPVGSQMKMTHP